MGDEEREQPPGEFGKGGEDKEVDPPWGTLSAER